jgi:hypothetical protein
LRAGATSILSLFFFLSFFLSFSLLLLLLLFYFFIFLLSGDLDCRLILCNDSVLAYMAMWDWWATCWSFTPCPNESYSLFF